MITVTACCDFCSIGLAWPLDEQGRGPNISEIAKALEDRGWEMYPDGRMKCLSCITEGELNELRPDSI